jgi:hypothetical protein
VDAARVLRIVLAGVAACSEGVDPAGLADPASCEGCHPDQVREWAGSMHAYAADDPVFLAMNRLGQRETGGALGDFCVRCHAPFAEGRDVESLPRHERGVTCAACHQIAEVVEVHNGGLRWDRDRTMRGGTRDPVATPAHASAYSPLVDATALESSAACGACHDVVSPAGVPVESTYAEWSQSVFSRPDVGLSCASCHMPGRDAPAAVGERTRRVHDHGLPGVDVALGPWPGLEVQRAGIDRDLAGVLAARLCAIPAGGGVRFDVTLDNVQAGHAFPSGVTHARRAWLHFRAEEAGAVTRELGAYAAGDVVPLDDPEQWVLGSRFLGPDGIEVAQVWDATAITSALLPPAVTLDPQDPAYNHAVTRSFFVAGTPEVARIIVRMQPVGLEIIDGLVAAGELDPGVRAAIPVLELAGTAKEWRRARDGFGCAP